METLVLIVQFIGGVGIGMAIALGAIHAIRDHDTALKRSKGDKE